MLFLCKTEYCNIKWKKNKFKKVRIGNRTCYYFHDATKLEDFDLDSILINENSHENILIYDTSYKILINPKPLLIRFSRIDGFISIYDETRYLTRCYNTY